jgi:hypothetical protein
MLTRWETYEDKDAVRVSIDTVHEFPVISVRINQIARPKFSSGVNVASFYIISFSLEFVFEKDYGWL